MYRLNRLSHNVTVRLIEGDVRVKSGNGLSSVTPSSNLDKLKNNFDIERVLKTLEDENALKYVRDADNNIKSIVFNGGEEISLDGLRANPLRRADAYTELSDSIRKFSPELAETSTLVGKTSDGVFERVGVRRLRWSEKQLAKLRATKSPKAALGVEQTEQLDRVVGSPDRVSTGDPEIDAARQAADENVEKVAAEGIDNPVADVVDEQIDAMGKSGRLLSKHAAGQLLEGATAVVVYSLCTINAINESYPATLRQSNDASVRQAAQLQAASDQISEGALNAAAVGAARQSLGSFSDQAGYQLAAQNQNWQQYRQLPDVDTPQPRNDKGWMGIFASIAGATNTAWNIGRSTVGGQWQEKIPYLNDVSPAAWTFTEFCSKINTLAGGLIFGLGTAVIEQVALNAVWPGGGTAVGGATKEASEGMFRRLLTAVTEKGISGIIREAIQGVIENTTKKISDITVRKILAAFVKKGTPIALETGAMIGMTYLIIKLANGVGGHTYTGTSDEDAGGKSMAGTNVMQASLLRTRMHGVPTDAVTNASYRKQQYADYLKEQSSKSFASRMFDFKNPYSTASRIAVYSPYNVETTKTFALNTLSPINLLSPKYAFSLIGSKLAPDSTAYAQSAATLQDDDEANNNIQQWGYTLEEEELMKTDEYSLASISDWADTPSGKEIIQNYDEKYGACYSTKNEMSDILLNEDKSGLFKSQSGDTLKDRCLDKLPDENKLTKDLFRWRLYRTDVITIDEAIDLQEVTENSTNTSGDSASAGEITDDSTETPCAEGTEDLGERDDAYNDGKRIKIRLCAINSIPGGSEESNGGVPNANGRALVSSIASEAWQKLGEAAKAAGIPLSAGSSWRTMAHQEQLCRDDDKCPGGNYNDVAKPGTSNHQAGTAIDISQIYQSVNGPSSGRSCTNPQTADNATYKWVAANARSFGIKNYANEAWHWGTSEAC